jgi:hypothetical protein
MRCAKKNSKMIGKITTVLAAIRYGHFRLSANAELKVANPSDTGKDWFG